MATTHTDRKRVVAALAEQLRDLEGERFAGAGGEVLSSGLADLDRLLPGGGLRRGTLVEWMGITGERGSRMHGGEACGAGTLALVAARSVLQGGGMLVVVDRVRRFYPPAALAWGIPLEQLIVVRPTSPADEAWTVDQCLRSRAVAAVWLALQTAEEHTLRRWQLAAESSGTLGLLVRNGGALGEPSWAELRLGVQAISQTSTLRARRLRIQLLRARSATAGGIADVELPATGTSSATWALATEQDSPRWQGAFHETSTLHLASSVAAATHRRPRRA